MVNDFSTIEHDYIHMKDYFSNYKFTYKERRSKLDFLQNITNEPGHDTASLIASSKEQLVEVKKVYKNVDLEIKEISKSIFNEEEKLKINNKILEELNASEEALRQELQQLTELNEHLLIQSKLNEELNDIEKEIKTTLDAIEDVNNSIEVSTLEDKIAEEKNLREERNLLATKQRRLTIINTENYIEDIYYWRRNYLNILEKIFGSISVTTSLDKFNLKISRNESVLEITVNNGTLYEAFLLKNQINEVVQEFEKVKEYSIMINDAKPLLAFFSTHC